MGNAWIVIEHGSKSLRFYLPIHIGNVLLVFGFNVQSQPEVRIQYGHQTAILNVTLLTIKKLLSIHTSNLLLKSGLDVQSQTKVRIRQRKNPISPPGGHFESDISENLHALGHGHKQQAY